MKYNVLGTMRFSNLFLFILFMVCFPSYGQNKYEREFRILKKQFPEKALHYISEEIQGAKRVRFYKEIDSAKISFEAKFKKDKLNYSIEFDENGKLEDIEIIVKQIDIPEASWANIQNYLSTTFKKSKIRKIQQQYPVTDSESPETTIKNAFQNLLLPSLNYELIVSAKKEREYEQFEILFDAEGNLQKLRKSLPPNYDHVLY